MAKSIPTPGLGESPCHQHQETKPRGTQGPAQLPPCSSCLETLSDEASEWPVEPAARSEPCLYAVLPQVLSLTCLCSPGLVLFSRTFVNSPETENGTWDHWRVSEGTAFIFHQHGKLRTSVCSSWDSAEHPPPPSPGLAGVSPPLD